MSILDLTRAVAGPLFRLGGWVAEQLNRAPAPRRSVLARFRVTHHPDHGFVALAYNQEHDRYDGIRADGTRGAPEGWINGWALGDEYFMETEAEANLRINNFARSQGVDKPNGGG